MTTTNSPPFTPHSDAFVTALSGKLVPHSIEAEQAVLGGLLIDNSAWDLASQKLCDQDFYRHDHRIIFRAMSELIIQRKPLDLITVSEILRHTHELDNIGGLSYLGTLALNTPSAANISSYAEIVHEHSILRQLVEVGKEISESAYDTRGRKAAEILDDAERKVFMIAEQGEKHLATGPEIISEILGRTIDKIDALFHANSSITGLPTGFHDFDKLTAGLQNSDLIIVAGRPSMGKTTFAMNIAEYTAMKTEKPILIFSMEMPAESLAMRMLASLGRIELSRIRSGQLKDNDWSRLTSALSMMSSRRLLIDDSGALSPMEVRSRARRMVREYGDIGLIVIDYLQLMRVPGIKESRTFEISEISRSLKALAKELNIPVMALSQLNRGLEQRQDKRPIMSDLRESGAIEQDADLIVFIYRDEFYNKESTEKGVAEIIIGKHRNGPTGMTRLSFLGHISRFENHIADEVISEGQYG